MGGERHCHACRLPAELGAGWGCARVWRAAIDAAAAERDTPHGVWPDGRGRANANSEVFTQRVNLHQTSAEVCRLCFGIAPTLGRMFSALNDWPAGYRFGGDQLLHKLPGAEPIGWHSVRPSLPHPPPQPNTTTR
eukprot:COSAG04_NODE_588_length_12325_cov_114.087682_4_plen_135_part_00